MPRFTSIEYAPAETRRLLRERLMRNLGREPQGQAPGHDGEVLPDEAMVRLLEVIDLSFGNAWPSMLAKYDAAREAMSDELPLLERLSAGWGRLVWGRVEVPNSVALTYSRQRARAGAFSTILDERFVEEYRLASGLNLDVELLAIAVRVQSGELDLRQLTCRSPAWVAARLWDRRQETDGAAILRTWVDRWKILGSPELAPSKAWDAVTGERFRQAVMTVVESEQALEDWDHFKARLDKEAALISGEVVENFVSYLPLLPTTLVDRVLWLDDNRIVERAYDSGRSCSDVLALFHLLLVDIDEQSFAVPPHPLAARLFALTCSRPDIFFQLRLAVEEHPRILADLLFYPPTCAVACLLIGKFRLPHGAFDLDIVRQANDSSRASAFEDAVWLLIFWLEKGLARPSEVAALLAWLHPTAAAGFIDDVGDSERLRLILQDALLSTKNSSLVSIVNALIVRQDAINRLGGHFAAALEIVALGDLCEQIDPCPLVERYIEAICNDEFGPFVNRIGSRSAAALSLLAERVPASLARFYQPINVKRSLADTHGSDVTTHSMAEKLSLSLRAHIRILSRAIVGRRQSVPDELVEALISAVWCGALKHWDKGRVSAFAPRHETNALGARQDRPIAIDLAATLRAISGRQREKLLSAILETDEPTLLAQLMASAPRDVHDSINRRLDALSPSNAGEVWSLTEAQARIEELLAAGALDAAAKFMEAETRLTTLGAVPGRAVVRLRTALRLLFARGEWQKIMATELPPDLNFQEKEEAADVIQFYKGLTLLVRGEEGDADDAEAIFCALHQRKPFIAAYAVNAIAARIGVLLRDDIFGRVEGVAIRTAQQILVEIQELLRNSVVLTIADRETVRLNQAVLKLALNEAADALALLPLSGARHVEERLQTYRAIALFRLGRTSEASNILMTAEEEFGRTQLLEAAWAHIRNGRPSSVTPGISINDDMVLRLRDAYWMLRALPADQQTSVVGFGDEPFTAFIVEQVRGAAASVVSLVPMMVLIEVDGREDDVTALIRELLLARLDFLKWSSADQSKGGFTASGNPGERDLIITQQSTVLTVLEAVVCSSPVNWKTVQEKLTGHFRRLVSYGTCRLFVNLAYVYDQDVQGVIDHLKIMAREKAPPGFTFMRLADIPLTDSRPNGFIADFNDEQGTLRVVFLALNMGQRRLKEAARSSVSSTKRVISRSGRS